jgi:hypothetical protein
MIISNRLLVVILTTLFIHKINSVMSISIKVKVAKACSLKNRGLTGKNEYIQHFVIYHMSSLFRSCPIKGFRDDYSGDAAQSKKSIYG